mgnify:CR=1 FL=1
MICNNKNCIWNSVNHNNIFLLNKESCCHPYTSFEEKNKEYRKENNIFKEYELNPKDCYGFVDKDKSFSDEELSKLIELSYQTLTSKGIDKDYAHRFLDNIVFNLLENLGYKESVNIIKNKPKWYG